jgi:methyltransferase (TIGR00027 family)
MANVLLRVWSAAAAEPQGEGAIAPGSRRTSATQHSPHPLVTFVPLWRYRYRAIFYLMTDSAIQHISDTARWAAVYRARETERKDALFRDPFARRLAGERGEQIARSMPFHERHSWSWATRTYLFDRVISEQIRQGADMVVNLAAGLDTRPYRMQLPAPLKWIEVDFPEILAYKEALLKAEKPACALERVPADLASAEVRRSLLASLAGHATKVLVISEGLLIYLRAKEVSTLAEDLKSFPAFKRWVLDIVSPRLLRMVQKNTRQQFGAEVLVQFAPDDGPEFFTRHGWCPIEVHSILKTAAELKLLPFFMRLLALVPERPSNIGSRPWSGVCLLAAY